MFEKKGLAALGRIEPVHVAAYREHVKKRYATLAVKRHLSAIRELFDSVDTSTLVGLRDRAAIAFLTYTFARVSAAVNTKGEGLYQKIRRWRVRLFKKNGTVVDVACHRNWEEYLFAYLDAAGLREENGSPRFRSAAGKTGSLTERPMHRNDVLRLIWRRAEAAGLTGAGIGCHTFRATGITAYLEGGGISKSFKRWRATRKRRRQVCTTGAMMSSLRMRSRE